MNKVKYFIAKFLKKARLSAVINSYIHPSSKIESGSNIVNSRFDRYSFCGYDCEIINCEIGPFTSIANNVNIGGAMHPIDWVSMSPVFYSGKDSISRKFANHSRQNDKITQIGPDVWIGSKVLIKQGVRIGIGAVVGMGSVVTKDVEPYSIVAGSPARLIRKRFDEKTISLLIKSKWWEFNDEKLFDLGEYFNNTEAFIKAVSK